MKPNNLKVFEQEARKLMEEAIILLVQKRADYGENALHGGQLGIVVRMSDKLARLENLMGVSDGSFKMKNSNVKETVNDTVRDLINYGLLFLMEGKK